LFGKTTIQVFSGNGVVVAKKGQGQRLESKSAVNGKTSFYSVFAKKGQGQGLKVNPR